MDEHELDFLKEAYRPVSYEQKHAMTRFTFNDVIPLISFAVIGLIITFETELNIIFEYGALAVALLAVFLLTARDKLRLMNCIEIYAITAYVMYTSVGAVKVIYYDIRLCEFEERTIPLSEKTKNRYPEYRKGETTELLFGLTEKKLFFISPKPLDF